jgi:hypothetical protein
MILFAEVFPKREIVAALSRQLTGLVAGQAAGSGIVPTPSALLRP